MVREENVAGCWVYVLRGRDGRLYTGITERLNERIEEHNRGWTKADRGRGPFQLIYREGQADYASARERETFLKSGVGRKWLKEKFKGGMGKSGNGSEEVGA